MRVNPPQRITHGEKKIITLAKLSLAIVAHS
jgi:hypothetical protein